ncbi:MULTISPECIES: YiiX/YebB-like N1pC/P60 family cysteine hydrolase [Alteromonadaceae]|uniref:YiiX/YebB-like N1pC/P60 family cysteine hydrolase n=1 Tax=Alteromonadaceae TaxID=72275 RepID=UPI001C07F7EB|nr:MULTISPECIES: YiiX/YebB-like N1pC/P60 family cysteine hydrolase [Aliiglaciecola]MBU2878458.1 lipo-like protein [Aliiglaciecola lipolytica]MDO6713322.1 YiiX/YebB-like N1pC/P60 family cysteine hydrolase [Aliiglaciecola sp. 2_MG-2023]MDO6754512.1 YiiX/YebB-like N1pC/P60 family cysteine hydrolase [Aliiglaciecola sp. 1_MG-2023]
MNPLNWIGNKIAHFLQKPSPTYRSETTCEPDALLKTLKKGDVLLIDGVSRVSTAIKYLTQSTWSHATLCISDQYGIENPDIAKVHLLEADVVEGVRVVNLQEYVDQGTRICRPVSLNQQDIDKIVDYARQRIGHQYDTKNILDLARYLIQTPPVPVGWRRNMLSLGSGDPTRAICSSLLAQAFQSIGYPILPQKITRPQSTLVRSKINHFFQSRHHTLFVPKDFDISPYFAIIKPTIELHFDPYSFNWVSESELKQENQQPTVVKD